MIIKSFPLISILVLFFSSFAMTVIKENKKVKYLSVLSSVIVVALLAVNFSYVVSTGDYYYKMGHFEAPWGIEFYIGTLEAVMGVLFSVVFSLVVWFSVSTIDYDVPKSKINFYYILLNILLASLLGIAFTNDIFNAFVFIEVSTLAGCGIIVVKDKKENIKATIKYLILSSLGSGLFLMAIAFLYSITGNLNMEFMNKELVAVASQYQKVILISIGLFTVGLGVKGAMFPLHIWLPDAHSSAPSPSSALLSAIVVKAAVLLLIKVYYRVYGFELVASTGITDIVLILGSVGMIIGSIFAITQKEIKRIIAYSSVAQMGYVFFGIGLGTPFGLAVSMFHIMTHALTKSALFLCVGAMMKKAGKKVEDLKGIGVEMPITLGIFTLGALSMVGIPILPGFISKWNFALASIDANKSYLLAVILVSSLLNGLYYFPVVINGYFGTENTKDKVYMSKELPKSQMLPIAILAVLMVALGVFSKDIIELLISAGQKII